MDGNIAGFCKKTYMENIPDLFDQVKNQEIKSLLQIYAASLPFNPFCTNELGSLITKPREHALGYSYIQHNPPGSVKILVIDYDDPESHYLWDDYRAPPPNFAVMNPKNGHSHLIYIIRNKIYRNNIDNLKPFRLLCAIEQALIHKIGADPYYANVISKNTLSETWVRYDFRDYEYDLEDFKDYLDLPKKTYAEGMLFHLGLGRNCTLFDELRKIAYDEIRRFKFEIQGDVFIRHLYQMALHKLNPKFTIPLSDREVYGIAKSIGKWTLLHHTPQEFKKIQQRRGIKSGKKRAEKATEQYKEIKELALKNPGMSNRAIARMLGISRHTVDRAKRYVEPTADNSEQDKDGAWHPNELDKAQPERIK